MGLCFHPPSKPTEMRAEDTTHDSLFHMLSTHRLWMAALGYYNPPLLCAAVLWLAFNLQEVNNRESKQQKHARTIVTNRRIIPTKLQTEIIQHWGEGEELLPNLLPTARAAGLFIHPPPCYLRRTQSNNIKGLPSTGVLQILYREQVRGDLVKGEEPLPIGGPFMP